MGKGQREGDTESETGSRLWAVSTEPDAGLELTECETMTWAEVGCLTDWATQVPLQLTSFKPQLDWFRAEALPNVPCEMDWWARGFRYILEVNKPSGRMTAFAISKLFWNLVLTYAIWFAKESEPKEKEKERLGLPFPQDEPGN